MTATVNHADANIISVDSKLHTELNEYLIKSAMPTFCKSMCSSGVEFSTMYAAQKSNLQIGKINECASMVAPIAVCHSNFVEFSEVAMSCNIFIHSQLN